ncbi:GTP cyclohydrolase I [Desulfofarcimen acetoxidans DSM 771]|uniref:GTP cyclohydrolase 1 n=1 Tax=Desulfofarcimen acetoxidans (strain ATCC 49208 / DSM 771 / KCTC 5769 / VKM B-1644 / 5575) TaxID=485916 RepID=C8W6F0_DESAS|nr:GTP cyclohydrolase I FolE [Desulfofarcimen acetoxidans]ACV62239.1 GTP cyclohydrolase I [Desulfofarcimen acetoxidans DSM 771]
MIDQEKIEKAVYMILEAIGEDPEREGLLETPARVARMYKEVFCGLSEDPNIHLRKIFNEEHEELVLVKDIAFSSMCEHHLLPFFGKAHVAYIPHKGRVTGLSKLARVVDSYAKRPQLQERLTSQIADCIMKHLNPYGVIVVVEAEHMCMTLRGIKKPGSKTVTSAVRGAFKSNDATRAEAFALIRTLN